MGPKGDDDTSHLPEWHTCTNLELFDDRHAWAMYDSVDDLASGFGSRAVVTATSATKGDDGQWRIAVLRLTRLRIDQVAPTPRPAGRTFPEPWHRPAPAAAGAPR